MQLVPETKMADARKYSVSGNHWPGEPRDHCLKLRPHLNFVPKVRIKGGEGPETDLSLGIRYSYFLSGTSGNFNTFLIHLNLF